jgi:pSer/pThr/pTyr-binding forkhead associated (FHA) protein
MEDNKKRADDAYLVINNQIYPIGELVITIGRKLDNDVVIQDPLVSRYHAEIRREGDQYFLHDLESTCGTYVNQKNVTKSKLHSGDIILFANVPIMFVDETTNLQFQSEGKTGSLPPKE